MEMNDLMGLLKEASKIIKTQEAEITKLTTKTASKNIAKKLADNKIIQKEAVDKVSKVNPETLKKFNEETIERDKIAGLGEPDQVSSEALNSFEKGLLELAEQHGWV